jgi:hypothetical protein
MLLERDPPFNAVLYESINMSNITPFLVDSQLNNVAALVTAADVMQKIQELIDSSWTFDYPLGSGWAITGSPNDFSIGFNQNFSYSGTIIPGVPAYTITPAVYVPPVMTPEIPAIPGWGTTNMCAAWGGKCTTSVPGTPSVPATTITPGYTIPALVSPAVPALTGGYSSDLMVNVTVQGVSAAINPLLESTTFVSTSAPTTSATTQVITYNLDSAIAGSALHVKGVAAVNHIVVTIGGVSTDLGSISTGTITLSPVPNIPLSFNLQLFVPPYNTAPPQFPATASTLAYTPIPVISASSVSDLAISTGVNAVADFIDTSLLDPLTSMWDALVCPLFSAVGANCPTAPTETLANYISKNATSLQQGVNSATQTEFNSLLASNLSVIQTYSQPIVATGWNFKNYTPVGPQPVEGSSASAAPQDA